MRTLCFLSIITTLLVGGGRVAVAGRPEPSLEEIVRLIYESVRDFPREGLPRSGSRLLDGVQRKLMRAVAKIESEKKNALKSALNALAGIIRKVDRAGFLEIFTAEVQLVTSSIEREIDETRDRISSFFQSSRELADRFARKLEGIERKGSRAGTFLERGDVSKYVKASASFLSGLEKLLDRIRKVADPR